MTKVYKILLHDHDLDNILFPAIDSATPPLNQQARGLIETQMVLVEDDVSADEPEAKP